LQIANASWAGLVIVSPIAPSSSDMMPTSAMAGTLVISNTPSAMRLAAINLSTEFLAPGTTTSPSSGPA
jgi:hypothetical protein